MIGYKATDKDGYSFSTSEISRKKVRYDIGEVSLPEEELDRKSKGECGRGLHLAKELHTCFNYLQDTPIWDARYWECEYDTDDVLGEGDDKVRVSKLNVIKEVSYMDVKLPNKERVFDNIRYAMKMKEQNFTTYDKDVIVSSTLEAVRRTCALDKEGRNLDVTCVRLHSIDDWDSVRYSVWDSVRASVGDSVRYSVWDSVRYSVWDSVRYSVRDSVRYSVRDSVRYSVRDSVWASIIMNDDANHGIPMLDCMILGGGIFYGVDDDGIAHVIVPALKKGHEDVVL